jgi:hypothetical protein
VSEGSRELRSFGDAVAIYAGASTEARPMGFDSTLHHFYEVASGERTTLEIYGYTDRFSYAPGESVDLHVLTTADTYTLEIQRDGAHPEVVHRAAGLEGAMHPTPADASVRGCEWPVTHRFEVPDDCPSGFFRVFLSAERDGRAVRHEHFFVVRPERDERRRILLVHSTATWTAYNAWGGSCHYAGITGPEKCASSPRLSIQRPLERGMLWLPVGAPRIPVKSSTPPGAIPVYPPLDFAYAHGFAKFYAAAGYATFQRPFFVWAEENGYALDHYTQHDLHFRPDLLAHYPVVVLVGHDEYWSRAMREAIDGYVEGGGHVARFGGNFGWQIRLEDEGATQVCYWGADDPVEGTDDAQLLTSGWEDPRVAWPGSQTLGLNGFQGIYNRLPGAGPRSSGGFTVYRPEHWAFAGTDLYYGDDLGGGSQVAGYEVDGLAYTFRDGLPYPTGEDGTPDPVEVLALCPALAGATERPHDGATYFVGEADVHAAALTRYGEDTEATRAKVRHGCGAIVDFPRGKGGVFNAGACEWVAGLIDRDRSVERITRNVLDRFGGRA